MSEKIKDDKNRWRNKIVSFRVSPEESTQLDKYVYLSGLTKQDYLASRILMRDIVVHSNSRTNKAIALLLEEIISELQRLEKASEISSEITDLISQINTTLLGFQENKKSPNPGR
ncbi:MAG: hypothetical protein R3Y45_08405 [Bacillota bacterium]